MNWIEPEIEKSIGQMKTKDDFCHFLGLLLQDYDSNCDFWQNQDLRSFLSGLQRYAGGEGGYMENAVSDREVAHWSIFADMLAAARAFD